MNSSHYQFTVEQCTLGGNRGGKARAKKMVETFWERFWNRVDKHGPLPKHRPELGPCWLWTGSLNTDGYGQVKHLKVAKMVHRMSFEAHFGPIPEGLHVCHHCDVPNCVNWNHHFLGTVKDNVADSISKNRRHYRHGSVPKRKGEGNGRAKLTEALVKELRKMDWSKFGSRSAKARELGMSVTCFTMMLTGETWKHI